MTTDTLGGVWGYSLALARALGGAGVEVTLAAMGREPSDSQLADAAAIPTLTLRTRPFRLEWMPDCWEDVRASGEWLLALEHEFEPRVVHLNGYCHGALPWSAPVAVVAHSCVLSWWEAVKHGPAPPEWARYGREVRDGLAGADAVVAPSRAMGEDIERLYSVPQVQVIANGLDPDGIFAPAAKEPIVFAAGRLWDEAKNLAALDRACAALPWRLLIAGDSAGPGAQPFVARSAVPLGALPPRGIADWLARAAIYALPARYEPFGLAVLEAALSGCALVLGDIPSLREHWDEAAVFVEPEDERGLRRALEAIIAAPAVRRHLGSIARERARRFTLKRAADSYLSLYSRLLDAAPAPTARVAANA